MLGRGVARLAAPRPGRRLRRRRGSSSDGRPRGREPRVAAHDRGRTLGSHGPNALEARPATARILAAAGLRRAGDREQPRRRRRARHRAGHDAGARTARARRDRRRRDRRGGLHAAHRHGARRPRSRSSPSTTPARGRARARRRRASPGGTRARARAAVDARPRRGRPRRRRPPRRLRLQPDHRPVAAPPRPSARGLGRRHRLGHGTARRPADRARPRPRTAATTIVATSLGNLVFDQHIPGTRTGELLEVLAGQGGVRAYRLGSTAQAAVERRRLRALADAARRRGGARRRVVALAPTGASGRDAPAPIARGLPRQGRRRRDRRSRGQRRPPARRLVLAPVPAHGRQRADPARAGSSTGAG